MFTSKEFHCNQNVTATNTSYHFMDTIQCVHITQTQEMDVHTYISIGSSAYIILYACHTRKQMMYTKGRSVSAKTSTTISVF